MTPLSGAAFLLFLFSLSSSTLRPAFGDRLTCWARCVATCVARRAGSDFFLCQEGCRSYDQEDLCGDPACWNVCKDMNISSASSPVPVTELTNVQYVQEIYWDPHRALLSWAQIPDIIVYLVQAKDDQDEFGEWQSFLVANTTFVFTKPALCPAYVFRVAGVTETGLGNFSNVLKLDAPLPEIPMGWDDPEGLPFIRLKYVLYVNEPYRAPGEEGNDDNGTLYVRFEPAFPLSPDEYEFNVFVTATTCPGHNFVAPNPRRVNGTNDFVLQYPGRFTQGKECSFAAITESLTLVKCDAVKRLPHVTVIPFDLSCEKNNRIINASCPNTPQAPIPRCDTDIVATTVMRREGERADVKIEWKKFESVSVWPVLYYLVRYGNATKRAEIEASLGEQAAVVINNEIGLLRTCNDSLLIETCSNTTTSIVLSGLASGQLYAYQICAVFNKSNEDVDWPITQRFSLDLRTPAVAQREDTGIHMAMIVVIPLAISLIVAVVAAVVICRRCRNRALSADEMKMMGCHPNDYVRGPKGARADPWEVSRQRLIIYEDQKLGAGAFGSVFKGKVTGLLPLPPSYPRFEDCEVAVKMLPEYADETSKSEFRREINLMKELGYHERIVNMLCCVVEEDPLCLVVEYCSEGDLLHYLRDRRKYMLKLEEMGVDIIKVENIDQVDYDLVLCLKDLLSFSWQACVGLEFLSQKGYIHRDVAARNVLVDRGKKVKIGDFGLCRYVNRDPAYWGKGGRLPVKWMAPEAIKSYEFTTKSDVWSYGVLLFEIITLGGSPYPSIQPADIEAFLDAGKRMEKPDNCPDKLYEIMLGCWQLEPETRTTFEDLKERLRELLESTVEEYNYLRLNDSRDYYNVPYQEEGVAETEHGNLHHSDSGVDESSSPRSGYTNPAFDARAADGGAPETGPSEGTFDTGVGEEGSEVPGRKAQGSHLSAESGVGTDSFSLSEEELSSPLGRESLYGEQLLITPSIRDQSGRFEFFSGSEAPRSGSSGSQNLSSF